MPCMQSEHTDCYTFCVNSLCYFPSPEKKLQFYYSLFILPTNLRSLSLSPTVSSSPTAEFLDEDVELLQAKGHKVERIDVLSLVEGTRRTNDLIIGVKDPRSADASALTMSNMP